MLLHQGTQFDPFMNQAALIVPTAMFDPKLTPMGEHLCRKDVFVEYNAGKTDIAPLHMQVGLLCSLRATLEEDSFARYNPIVEMIKELRISRDGKSASCTFVVVLDKKREVIFEKEAARQEKERALIELEQARAQCVELENANAVLQKELDETLAGLQDERDRYTSLDKDFQGLRLHHEQSCAASSEAAVEPDSLVANAIHFLELVPEGYDVTRWNMRKIVLDDLVQRTGADRSELEQILDQS
ncbi:MAG: hypothetical protein CMI02_10585 [Oceanospirillaceae bacterium]|nr:hypothetical protein [Oceanospirillaceae bacterium]